MAALGNKASLASFPLLAYGKASGAGSVPMAYALGHPGRRSVWDSHLTS